MTKEISNKIENENVDTSKLKSEIEKMIENAKTDEDFEIIGEKLDYAINNNFYSEIGVIDLQLAAANKEKQIYNNKGESYTYTD